LGVINQNLLLIDFLLEIYIQLEQKCLSEQACTDEGSIEDIKKDTFRQAQCDNLV
jgi:hypothetical protein